MTLPFPILVLHDVGDPAAGAPWRDALAAHWRGAVFAPDLPGHGTTPAALGGSYEAGDAVLTALPLYREIPGHLGMPVVIGVGVNGWAAQLLALAGRASALVLVDGLNGPWRTPEEQIATGSAWVRAIAADARSVEPAPRRGLDPRAAHGVPSHGSKRLALKAAAAMSVPVLLLESPASPLDPGEVDELAASFAAGATVVAIDSPTAAAAVPVIATSGATSLAATPLPA